MEVRVRGSERDNIKIILSFSCKDAMLMNLTLSRWSFNEKEWGVIVSIDSGYVKFAECDCKASAI